MKGTIKKLMADKGFGFIQGDDGQDYFFHRSVCKAFDRAYEGQAVNFGVDQADQKPGKGPRATSVVLE